MKLRENFTVIATAVMVLPIVVIILVGWQFDRPPFDLSKLQELQRGMTQQQVREILGEPQSRDATVWHYSRMMSWPTVHVRFDGNGRVESHDYDF